MRASSRLGGAAGLGMVLLCLWLVGALGPFGFSDSGGHRVSAATRDAEPILLSDIPPGRVVTVASGRQGHIRWFLVVSTSGDLGCFGLRVNVSRHHGLACSHGPLGRGEAFGGIVFAPSELTKPVVVGEVSQEASTVDVAWARGRSTSARLAAAAGRDAGVKYFVALLPRHIRRVHLVARDAGSEVIGRLRVCCPLTGALHSPMLRLCHGHPRWGLRPTEHTGRRSELKERLACPPVDLVRGAEFVTSAYD
jgi:hypothetical protein